MNALHITGAGLGTILGTLLAPALKKYAGYDITATEAANLALYGLGAGLGLAHAIGLYGLAGIGRILLHGTAAPPMVTAIPPVPAPPAPAPPPPPVV